VKDSRWNISLSYRHS